MSAGIFRGRRLRRTAALRAMAREALTYAEAGADVTGGCHRSCEPGDAHEAACAICAAPAIPVA